MKSEVRMQYIDNNSRRMQNMFYPSTDYMLALNGFTVFMVSNWYLFLPLFIVLFLGSFWLEKLLSFKQ